MSIQSFGVTRSIIEEEMAGVPLPSETWDTRVTRWIQQYSAEVMAHLKHQGYDPATVEGWGSSHPLYLIAQQYVTHSTAIRVISSSSLQHNSKIEDHVAAVARLELLLRDKPESVAGDDHDPQVQRGGFRTNKRSAGDGVRDPGFWKRGMGF